MNRKIIFLTISTFNQRDFKRFGIELLEKNGFRVEVWDFTYILFPHIARNHKPPGLINWSGHKVFKEKKRALKNLENLDSDTLIITFMPYNPKFYSIFKAISAGKAKYAPFCANAYPSGKAVIKKKREQFLYNLKKLQKNPFTNLINYIYLKAPSAWIRLKPPALILAGGMESIRYQPPIDRSTEILWIHALDYDLYLEEKNKPSVEEPKAVFLDEYLPSHPDFFRYNLPPPIESDKYYPMLNRFFALIEQQLKLKIIIAAHPRSHYEDLSDLFGGREGIHGQTVKLVKESQLVLAHTSNAINFANLFRKPVIFLTSLDLNESHIGAKIRETANFFGKKPVYLDKDLNIDWDSELKVSKVHYESYQRNYIKKDNAEELPFWQVVANRLKKEL